MDRTMLRVIKYFVQTLKINRNDILSMVFHVTMHTFIRQRSTKTDRNTDYNTVDKTCTFTIWKHMSQDM